MNFRFIQLIALSGAITLSAAFGISCANPLVGNGLSIIAIPAPYRVTLPAIEADESRRDWGGQAPFPLDVSIIPPSERMEFVFPDSLNPAEEDFILLFYHGDEINEENLRSGRWGGLAALAQFQWHEESQVGGVAIAGKFSHLNLARLVPSGRRIIGGVRYTQREQKNSSVFYSLDGKKVERLFFSVRL